MNEQFKVLSAALALNEFTVEQLAARARVNETTVRSVLARRRDLFEAVGKVKTGRAGGRPFTHRLRLETAGALKDELAELQAALPLPERPRPPLPDTLALDTAEEFLTHRFQRAADTAKRREILDIAQLNIESTRDEVDAHFADNTEAPEFHELNRRLTTLGELHKALQERTDLEELISACHKVLQARIDIEEMMSKDAAEFTAKYAAEPTAAQPVVAAESANAMPSLYDRFKALQQSVSSLLNDSLQGQDVLVVNAAADKVAAAVSSVLTTHEGVHVLTVALDARRDLDAQLQTWIEHTEHKLACVIMAVNSAKIPTKTLDAARRQFGQVMPVVLDVANNVALRNDILKRQGVYQAFCAVLEPEALLGVVKRPLLDSMHAASRMADDRLPHRTTATGMFSVAAAMRTKDND